MEKIVFDDNSEIIGKYYTDLFYSNLGLRPCCSTCKYSTYKRVADFTVGDYWGVENYNPEFYDNFGISLVFLNTKRAQDIRHFIEDRCETIESDIQRCQQPNMISPTPIPSYRNEFWLELREHGFSSALKKYTNYGGILTKLRRRIYRYTGKWYRI